MQAVAELQEDDVCVVAHRQQYLPVVLCLFAVCLLHHHDVVYLCHAVYDGGHPLAEHHAKLVEGYLRVLHHVVQQGADHGYGAEPDLLDGNQCHRQGVEDIWLAAFTPRAGMGFLGNLESPQYLCSLFLREGLQFATGRYQFLVFGLYLAFFALLVNNISRHCCYQNKMNVAAIAAIRSRLAPKVRKLYPP